MPLPDFARSVRDADWLDRSRALGYARIFGAIAGLALIGLVVVSRGAVDPRGEPVGTDFASFWTASKLALSGAPRSVYDPAVHFAAQKQAFGDKLGYYAFFYPPIYLLVCLPLALLPYLAALAVWLGATGAAWLAMVRRYAGGAVGLTPLLAFPAVFVTIGHGQNAFLTGALFGFGALLMDRRPVLAGLLFGSLACKPHLAVVLPFALAATGRWRLFLATGATALAWVLASVAVFGVGTWEAFFAIAPLAKATLDQNLVGAEKMQSLYAAVRVLGGSGDLAYAAQIGLSVCVLIALVLLVRRRGMEHAHAPAMAAATLLCSPFLLDYDLALLAIPLAWLVAAAARTGFLPYEKIVVFAGFALPAVSRLLAGAAHVPLAPVVILLVFWCVARRASVPARNSAPAIVAAGEAI